MGEALGQRMSIYPIWRILFLVFCLGAAAGFTTVGPVGLRAPGLSEKLRLQRVTAAQRRAIANRNRVSRILAAVGPKRTNAVAGEWLNTNASPSSPVEDVVTSVVGKAEFGTYGVSTKEGRGKGTQVGGIINQDATFAGELSQGLSLFGVFDGHGEYGGEVSNFISQHLPPKIQKKEQQLRSAKGDTDKATACLTPVFSEVHDELCAKDSGVECFISGSTGLVIAVVKDGSEWRLIVANTGDCRCVLAQSGWGGGIQTTQLSTDQTPDRLDERARIEALGGVIGMIDDRRNPPELLGLDEVVKAGIDLGPARVFWWEDAYEPPFNKFFPGLAMARSFGDQCLDALGVLPVPEVSIHTVKPRDRFIVIASDGVWQVMSNEEVVACVVEKPDVGSASADLVRVAAKKWDDSMGGYRDDITCVVVAFEAKKK